MSKITPPNYTQTPNVFFDEIMRELQYAELKIMLAIMRKTFGWQKKKDKISYSQIQEMTGLSRQGIADGLKLLIEKQYIVCTKKGQTCEYQVKILDQSSSETGQATRLVPVKLLDQLEQKPVKQLDTQKKVIKETNKEISSAAAQSVFNYYYEKYKLHYNNKPVCNVGRIIKQIKIMLVSSSLTELCPMIDYIWSDSFVSTAGHSPETVFTGSSVSKYRARIKQSEPDRQPKQTACTFCGYVYTDFCRNPDCPGLV
jgi:phage replication O-like protein O